MGEYKKKVKQKTYLLTSGHSKLKLFGGEVEMSSSVSKYRIAKIFQSTRLFASVAEFLIHNRCDFCQMVLAT